MQEFANSVGGYSNHWSYGDHVVGFAIARFVDSEARSFDGAKIERAFLCSLSAVYLQREGRVFDSIYRSKFLLDGKVDSCALSDRTGCGLDRNRRCSRRWSAVR